MQCNRDNDEFTMRDWKCRIQNPSGDKSSWIVALHSKSVARKNKRFYVCACNSLANAVATKARILVLRETVPIREIKAMLVVEKRESKSLWSVYSCRDSKRSDNQFRVSIYSRPVFNGKRKTFKVGYYESKSEAENVIVRVVELLETLDPLAAIAQIRVLENRSSGRIVPDNLIPGEHDAQIESVSSLPFIISDDKMNTVDIRNMVLSRIALFKAYYQAYIQNDREPFFWVPSRKLENVKLAILPIGLPALMTKDRSAHSLIPRSGEAASRMLFIMDEAEAMLRSDTTIRQRCVCFYFIFTWPCLITHDVLFCK
jgi:hypothetical protein